MESRDQRPFFVIICKTRMTRFISKFYGNDSLALNVFNECLDILANEDPANMEAGLWKNGGAVISVNV